MAYQLATQLILNPYCIIVDVSTTRLFCSLTSHMPPPPHMFLNYLNQQHNNINFTMETETNRSLSFLDVPVYRNADGLSTSVFSKPTFSGLEISFFSFCSKNFKSNSILTLLHQAYNVCSSYSNLHKEFNFVTSFFKSNGCPLHLIQNKIIFFFIIVTSLKKIRVELCNLLKQYFPSIKFNIILVNRHTIGSLFNHKDRLNKDTRSAVA